MAYIHPTLKNIAPQLSERGVDLDEIAAQVLEDYRNDRESRSEWEDIHRHWVDLYFQKDKPGTASRWPGASEESFPLLTEACNQFHTRAYASMFANRRLVVGHPVGRASAKDIERGERIGLHMTWQITVQDPRYRMEKDRLLLALPLHGTMFTKAWHDPTRGINMVRNVRAVDLLVPYGVGPRDIEDVTRKTELIWTTVHQTRVLVQSGYLTEEGTPTALTQDHLSAPDIALQSHMGETESALEKDRPVLLLESHRLLDLDEDGIAEPYIVVVDVEGRKVLRVAIRWDTDELGTPTDGKRPVEYYTPYHFLENPDGFYGLGLGHILGELNKATNKILRQQIDAGTLANAGNHSGFISQAFSGPQGQELSINMGKFIKIPASIDDINKAIYTFKFPGPAAAQFQALSLLLMRADRLGMNTEAVTGQLERALQPTTVLALLEQSNQVFSSVHARIVYAWTQELNKLYRMNRQHLPAEEYFAVLDIDGGMVDRNIARDDYAGDMQVVPTVDPQMQSERERLQKAQIEYQTLIANPLVQASPVHFYNVVARYLRALRVDNIVEVLPHPMQLPPLIQQAMQAGMLMTMNNELGLPNGGNQSPGGPGMAPGPGNAMGAGGPGEGVPGAHMEDGSGLGGTAPGAGSAAGR